MAKTWNKSSQERKVQKLSKVAYDMKAKRILIKKKHYQQEN